MESKVPGIPCVPNPECRLYNTEKGCFEDTHHIFKQSEAKTKTQKDFCRLAINQVVLCREIHQLVEVELGWPAYPPKHVMDAEIERAKQDDGTA